MKVLLAIDGSQYSIHAANLTKSLFAGSSIEMTISTVIPEHPFPGQHSLASLLRSSPATVDQVLKAQEEHARGLLSEASASLAQTGMKIETVIRRGDPAEEIVMTSREIPSELVVVGLKGKSDAPEFSLGGVAHKVIRHAPCSVLVTKGSIEKVASVLIPIDGSKHSAAVVEFLLKMPLPLDVQILLVVVVQSSTVAFMGIHTLDKEANERILAEIAEAERLAIDHLIAEAAMQLRERGYTVSAVVTQGDPSRQILDLATRRKVDMIALGAKGLTGVAAFLLGSVAQRVSRSAPCSVLVVRPPKE